MGLLDVFRKKKEEEWPEQMVPSSEPSEVSPVLPSLAAYRARSAHFSHSKKTKSNGRSVSSRRKKGTSHTRTKKSLHRGTKRLTKSSRSLSKSLSRKILKHTHLKPFVVKNLKKGKSAIFGSKSDLLDDALVDLGKELRDLNSSHRMLEQRFGVTSSELERVQAKKVRLQTQIASSLEKETSLTKKRAATKDKLMALDQKIQKVKSIQRELKEVEG